MIKYMKRGTKGEIAMALYDEGFAYNKELDKVEPWVGYDPVAEKMYCAAKDGYDAFPVNYTIKATCGAEPVESKGNTKAAPQLYYNYMEIGAFGDANFEPGYVIDLELPSCAMKEDGWYDISSISELVIDGNAYDIYADDGEGGFVPYDDGFYFSNPVNNLKLTLTQIEVNDPGERSLRGETKAPSEPETQDVWVLTFDEKDPR